MTRKPWATSRRVVPGDWKTRKAKVLRRDRGICHVCGGPGATEVDHLLNVARGGNHELSNLAAIHARPCHLNKTKAEAAAGRKLNSRQRPAERHPGLLP
jgi:5-methylcytosine-specific restriction protein A